MDIGQEAGEDETYVLCTRFMKVGHILQVFNCDFRRRLHETEIWVRVGIWVQTQRDRASAREREGRSLGYSPTAGSVGVEGNWHEVAADDGRVKLFTKKAKPCDGIVVVLLSSLQ